MGGLGFTPSQKPETHDFQVESLYMSEDGEEIFDEETYIEDIDNLDILDREENDDFQDEVIAANDVKQLTEEELNHIRPYVGKEFDSQEDVYDFYNRFAGNIGFSIRSHSTNKSRVEPFEVIGRTFCCSRQGLRDPRAKPVEQRKRQRADVRTNCKEVMMIKRKKDRWIVSRIVEEHNHKLVSPSKRHILRSLRILNDSQKQTITNYRLAGVKTNQMIDYLAVEHGGVANVGFLSKDARNYLITRRQLELKHGDAQAVLDYFQRQQMKNPSFFYSIQVDSQGQMTNFFWSDDKSRMDYLYFRDVVCFDPTYSTNRYDMPFVPIVGINHHHQTVIFGGALLYSESEESFAWVMKTWMRAMHGKTPKVILTGQESAIGGAIARVLPGARHIYCLWHISRNAMKNLSNVTKEFVSDFSNCLWLQGEKLKIVWITK
ncbi:protein FAR1-RELATED SEQUENCE 5-like [Papaver somniferum]|uniref:protein FAR1-RELATED SEQUENCE 5-like n=1 Tax=Papaver somniferum TaxID=3469 RepID=UPI000E6FCB8D|nr:protein FAR1-RELATED SEQUENCE 5-like [Papaver somniferum]